MNNHSETKSVTRTIRNLHRDIGFLVIGLTLMYCTSGIILIYREDGFLKFENKVETTIAQGLSGKELESALHLRKMKVEKQDGNIVYLNYGQYNTLTGHVSYTTQEYPWIIQKFNSLHLSPSASTIHLFGLLYGILLFFLAMSSLFMYKNGTKMARRGIILASVGIVAAFFIVL